MAEGWRVRVLTRSRHRLDGLAWADRVDVVEGDASKPADVERALRDVEVAYYLLHSMDGKGDFVARDRDLAMTFADAARQEGVRRVVYLGGLHPQGELSPHLASRVEVGEIFLAGPVPATVLQAGVVLGAGSASFDMLRHLTERLPAMVAPKWLRNRIQPIAIADVVHYLVGSADLSPEVNRSFDIGGPEVFTYAEMMQRYAAVAGLRRRIIVTLPVLTPALAGLWVGLVTPVPAGIARPLVGSLVHEAVCREEEILEVVGSPAGGRTPFDAAVSSAVRGVDTQAWGRLMERAGTVAVVMGLVGAASASAARRMAQNRAS
jgi:uncharacterized protein YbjT (DUF2867 family)